LAKECAVNNLKISKGLKDLNEGWDDNRKAIETNNEYSSEYIEAMQNIKDSMRDMFNIEVSDKFIKDNLNEIEKAAEGDLEALDELQKAVGKDYIANMDIILTKETANGETYETITNELYDFVDELNNLDTSINLGENTTIDQSYLDSLQEMLNNGQITAD
jgi:hypothetical protein